MSKRIVAFKMKEVGTIKDRPRYEFVGKIPMELARKSWADRFAAVRAAKAAGFDVFANGDCVSITPEKITPEKIEPEPLRVWWNMPAAAVPGHVIKVDDAVKRPVALVPEGGGSHGKETQVFYANLFAASTHAYKILRDLQEWFENGTIPVSGSTIFGDSAETFRQRIGAYFACVEGRE